MFYQKQQQNKTEQKERCLAFEKAKQSWDVLTFIFLTVTNRLTSSFFQHPLDFGASGLGSSCLTLVISPADN